MGSKFRQQKPKQLHGQSDCITQSGASSLHPISINSLKQWHGDPLSLKQLWQMCSLTNTCVKTRWIWQYSILVKYTVPFFFFFFFFGIRFDKKGWSKLRNALCEDFQYHLYRNAFKGKSGSWVSWGFNKVHLMTTWNVDIHKIQNIVTNLCL